MLLGRSGAGRAALAGWLGCLLSAALTPASAHPAYLTVAQATIKAGGEFQITMQFDTLAFALNDTSARIGNAPMEALLAGPPSALQAQLDEAKRRFIHGCEVVTDRGPAVVPAVVFPDAADVAAWCATSTPVLPVTLPVRMTGHLPSGAGSVAFRFPFVLDQVILTVERPGEEPTAEPVDAGETSTAWPIRLQP